MNDRIKALEDALEWYAEQARLCRLIHSEGDAGRQSLSDDGGSRARPALAASRAASDCHQPDLVTAQCCMCGRTGLSTAEDGGPECELNDGRWVCSRECYDRAVDGVTVQDAARVPETDADRFDRADWFWRTMDPDDNGDTPSEAISRAMIGNYCVCKIAALRAIAGGEK